jgi:hypothetical protein
MKKKFVRIDAKTVIVVNKDRPEAEARAEYLLKIEENRRKFDGREKEKRWKL